MNLVDVGGVERGGEGAEGEEIGVRWGEGMRVETGGRMFVSMWLLLQKVCGNVGNGGQEAYERTSFGSPCLL